MEISVNRILTTTPLQIMACIKDDICCKLQNTPGHNILIMIGHCHGDGTFVILQPKMGIFSISGEAGKSLSKDVLKWHYDQNFSP